MYPSKKKLTAIFIYLAIAIYMPAKICPSNSKSMPHIQITQYTTMRKACQYICYIRSHCDHNWGIILITLKDDNTTGNLYLCNLFHVLSDYICTGVCKYTTAICIDGMIMNMCPWLLLVAILFYFWYMYICVETHSKVQMSYAWSLKLSNHELS